MRRLIHYLKLRHYNTQHKTRSIPAYGEHCSSFLAQYCPALVVHISECQHLHKDNLNENKVSFSIHSYPHIIGLTIFIQMELLHKATYEPRHVIFNNVVF